MLVPIEVEGLHFNQTLIFDLKSTVEACRGSTKNTPQNITIQKPMDLILNVAINSWTIGSCNPVLDQWKKWTKFSLRSFYLIFVVVVVLVLVLIMGGKFRN